MAALGKDRNTSSRLAEKFSDPVKAGAIIYAGALTALDASGYLVPGSTATTLTARGMAMQHVDNSNGADGDVNGESAAGPMAYRFANDGSIDRTKIGTTAYIVDDQTVAATDGAGTRSAAGEIVDVDADGVWIKF